MAKIDRTAVETFFRHYHVTKTKRPNLYRTSDDIVTVVLPADLIEFSNAAAGHSGFGAGARPVGIRRAVRDSDAALSEIFDSPDSLEQFIISSECDGVRHVEEVRLRHDAAAMPRLEPMVNEVFWKRYNKDVMQHLVSKFGKDTVQQSYSVLTIGEFQSRFGLPEAA